MTKNTTKEITLKEIKENNEFYVLIDGANKNLEAMGYTEHGLRHVGYVSNTTGNILRELGYDDRTVELGKIAGWIHDIGNIVNRTNHGSIGATMSFDILTRMGMSTEEIALIIGAVGSHEEQTGLPVNPISSALIIADKSDAHRSRVNKRGHGMEDIHDRVNLSITQNFVTIDKDKKVIRLFIFMDTSISATMEYLQIYLSRIILTEKASNFIGCNFELYINNAIINRQRTSVPSVSLAENESEVSQD